MYMNHLEIFSHLQVIGYSRQYLLLRIDILQKTVVGCLWSFNSITYSFPLKHLDMSVNYVATAIM